MTQVVLTAVLIVLVGNVLACLVRVVNGPSGRDRLIGVILAGTTGCAAFIVASVLTEQPALRDAALVIVALATVAAVTRISAEQGGRGEHRA